MKFRKNFILLVLIVFSSFMFVSNVYALDEEVNDNTNGQTSTLDDSVLSDNISNIKFISGNAITMGSLVESLTVDSLLSGVSSEFMEQYNISSVEVKNGDSVLSNEDTVLSEMTLLFTLGDDSTISYVVKVVGDLNDDGIVNNDDVELLIDSILTLEDESTDEEDEVDVKEDINQDSDVSVVLSVGVSIDTVGTTYASALLALIFLLSKKNANPQTAIMPSIAMMPMTMLHVGALIWKPAPEDLGL